MGYLVPPRELLSCWRVKVENCGGCGGWKGNQGKVVDYALVVGLYKGSGFQFIFISRVRVAPGQVLPYVA